MGRSLRERPLAIVPQFSSLLRVGNVGRRGWDLSPSETGNYQSRLVNRFRNSSYDKYAATTKISDSQLDYPVPPISRHMY